VEVAAGNSSYSQAVTQRGGMRGSLASREPGRPQLHRLAAGALRQGHILDVIRRGERALRICFTPKADDVAVVQRCGTFCSYSVIILALW